MSRRSYLDLTPMELMARQYVAWGLGFCFLPLLLSSCHFGNYLCNTSWHADVSPLVTMWSLFPWMLPVAVAAVGGLGLIGLGASLLATADPAHVASAPLHAIAFKISVGSLFAILIAGGFGYFLLEAISPGFYRARSESTRLAWLAVQMFFIALYVSGALLTLAPSIRNLRIIPINR
jgi:hypothetical protein